VIALTKSEFNKFNLKSRLNLTNKDGILLSTKCEPKYILSMYQMYDFQVVMLYDIENDDITKIEPVNSTQWVDFCNDN
jgi:hypothetical protein